MFFVESGWIWEPLLIWPFVGIDFFINNFTVFFVHRPYLNRDLEPTILSSILFSILKMCFRCQPLRRQVLLLSLN